MGRNVRIRPFDCVVEVADGESVLEAILRAGHYVHHGCRNGRCGSCVARELSGELVCALTPGGFVLSESDRREGKLLLCQTFAATPNAEVDVSGMELDEAEFSLGVDGWSAEIVRAEALAPSLRLVTLQSLEGARRWRAGAHVSLELPDGSGVQRSYSLLDPPRSDGSFRLLLRVLSDGRFSSRVDALAGATAKLRIRGPLGRFALRPGHWPAVFIAGGTGIAPIHAMLEELAQARSRRPVRLLYGAKSEPELVLLDELRALSERLPQLAISTITEHGTSETGDVSTLIDRSVDGAEVYVCGPSSMVEACRARLAALGARPRRITSDSFVASS